VGLAIDKIIQKIKYEYQNCYLNRDVSMKSIKSILYFLLALIFLIIPLNAIELININREANGQVINEVTFQMNNENSITLETINNNTGSDAENNRSRIDNNYGNSDGFVSEAEAQGYRNSLQNEVKNLKVTQNTYFDRNALEIQSTTVQILNAEGAVNSTQAFQIIYTSELEPIERISSAKWHTIVFLGNYYGNNTIKLLVPNDWQIAHNPKNIQVYYRSENNREIIGRAIEEYDVELKIFNPSRLIDEDDIADENFLMEIFSENYILILPVLLAIIIVVIILMRSARKRSDQIIETDSTIDDSNDSEQELKDFNINPNLIKQKFKIIDWQYLDKKNRTTANFFLKVFYHMNNIFINFINIKTKIYFLYYLNINYS
jgi:biopolymer transport protein ExbB/TolQ